MINCVWKIVPHPIRGYLSDLHPPAVAFNFNTSNIRVVDIGGNPWFVAADVVDVVGYSTTNNMVRVLDPEQRSSANRLAITSLHHSTVLITEGGLYKLALRSDKPEAKAFQDWVTKVVLPAIRKDGGYVMGEDARKGDLHHDNVIF